MSDMVKRGFAGFCLVWLLIGCGIEAEKNIGVRDLRAEATSLGLVPIAAAPVPVRTPLTDLGELLFYDRLLSGEKDVSCATCHHPAFGFADGRERSIGTGGQGLGPQRAYVKNAHKRFFGRLRETPRNSPTVMNLALLPELYLEQENTGMFWDGRVTTLRDQLTAPLRGRDEMKGDAYPPLDALANVMVRLSENQVYVDLFRTALRLPSLEQITVEHFELAMEAFEKILISPATGYDRYLLGAAPPHALFERGLELFIDLKCVGCHSGILLSDMRFHRSGAPMGEVGRALHGLCDIGREEVTANSDDRLRFRTPSLRELKHTAPYTHAGRLETLADVVRFFVSDDNHVTSPCIDLFDAAPTWERSPRTALSDRDVTALVAFLESISTPESLDTVFPPPTEVPSGLPIDQVSTP